MEAVALVENFGVWGLIVFGLGAAVVGLWRRLNKVQDDRVTDQKEHTAQIIENTRTLDRALDVVRGRSGD